jgi:putative transcriptional regulator
VTHLRHNVLQVLHRLALLPLAFLACVPALQAAETSAPAIFLVAKPELQDPSFAQAVVLVVFPKGAGPLGVILNRPTRLTLKDMFPEEQRLKTRSETLYMGGPVRLNALMFLFRRETAADTAFPVVDDLYLSGNGDLLDELLAAPGSNVQRFFMGYSGWGSTQLDYEIAQGAWYVLPADLDTVVKTDPKTLWRDLMRRATAVKT